MENKKEMKIEIYQKTGFILDIIGLISFFVMGLGIIPSVAGLIFSIISYKKEKNDKSMLNIKLAVIAITLNLLVLIASIVNMIIYNNYK